MKCLARFLLWRDNAITSLLQEEIQSLKQGQVRAREPAKPQQQTYSAFRFGASQLGPSRLVGSVREISAEEQVRHYLGTWQARCLVCAQTIRFWQAVLTGSSSCWVGA